MLDSLTVALDSLARGSLATPLLAIPVYALAGFASSLFPCVYPLIPITVGILQKRTSAGEARWKHPLFYWLGTILAYTMLGLVAAAGGGAFNRIMQNGIVIVLTGMLFLFMVFVMIDWHPIAFMGGDRIVQSAARKKGFGFTTIMGFGAGLVASACVAPALVTMLLFIAQSSAAGGSYLLSVAYGGLLSASFGMGIGVPFFVAGILGARLARPGNWMNYIKYAFAILVLLAALFQLYKGFSVLGLNTMDITILFLGFALLAAAALLGLRPPEKGDRPALTRFLFSLLFFALGLASVIRGINPGMADRGARLAIVDPAKEGSPPQSSNVSATSVTEDTVAKETIAGLTFYRDESFAMAKARREKRPLFIDFYADWCTNCKDFYRLLGSDTDLNRALAGAVILKIKDTDPVFPRYQDNHAYPELNIGLPFFVVLNPDGSFRWKTTNYRDRSGMMGAVRPH